MTEYTGISSAITRRSNIDEGEIIGISILIVMILVIILNALGIG